MAIDTAQVKHVARLAKVALNEQQLPRLVSDLNAILAFAGRLQDARLDSLSPMAHPLDQTQPLRVDQVTETDQRTQLQAGAPAVSNGLFLVPKVIESD
ncbi:Asp-tRNA(Asn)/Glu-tRNA(Gln) amidotransferase subunit GatC [Halothiobacillus sp. DCM-1]|uniref:Asp-tRNA(Asn)/Glu-tRNA(Gln) amidotransferase subunit GatC n=1 Tax=Halothiobacillus sp. DCM-1 TaxID=3112558 RepID=UPI003247BA25